ncbi:isoaspartyl peptidase/L-asparaginase family protein [Legionella jordanis]|uniref:Isoaspartyl peptidase n=1 Tax=Legionella jordanis TaxID=456 RepID=A0A0W0V941_9GAMM|nr:isoaspartyl peptidase/L-asparaginase [Legionella jordanis]KTD16608.1 isoaspartyl dipeptidase with L-asparaginase activity [Legionella jordanis]RMX03853.1 isoaspartyl peptidase/L-asparaginase [Legionella jordanis]RMX22085.1 isoaspartyl peptidase/L-asparaginase [Legionella jordanis]VEH11928.1 isoaspartyl dipeptidase with L-asparaginase activity [Legionella jordanis]HAT8712768.1 isoaspartyl peptidase/L-asparaginase [Legionella jordanis]
MTIAIAVHGGAGPNTPFLKAHMKEAEQGLADAARAGYGVLQSNGSAVDAVEEAVKILEDNPMFNAGRGSSLNCDGEVEMDASIMDGRKFDAGAVSMVRLVKNPISLARLIMEKTNHVLLSGYGALEFAKRHNLTLKPPAYFIAEHKYDEFEELRDESYEDILLKKIYGTVGAVALDHFGNLAAATSTGGTSNCLPGRVGDSCHIGAGCYANNNTCAVSGTGEGEFLITRVIGHSISVMCEMHNMGIQEACQNVIHVRNKDCGGEMGVIALNPQGDVGIAFNTEVMKRAWIGPDGQLHVQIKK